MGLWTWWGMCGSGWGTGTRQIITKPPRPATRRVHPLAPGAWFAAARGRDDDPTDFRAADRNRLLPILRYIFLGFRCAKAP
jgi:hypothetical protein